MTSYEAFSDITAERHDRVLVLTLDRPGALNAMTEDLHAQLADVFRAVASDEEADVVVFTGAGRAFSAGGDLDWIKGQPESEYERSFREARQIIMDLLDVPQPVIAAVNGHAVGLGATLALFCDMAFVAEEALIGDPHVVLGLVPGDGASIVWPMVAGPMRAKRHLLTGDPISGADAATVGMVTEALPADEVLPAAMAMAERLAALPQTALRGTKIAVNAQLRQSLMGLLDVSLNVERLSRRSPDHREALNAYVERLRQG
jgi:enoyl-CoA hydratase